MTRISLAFVALIALAPGALAHSDAEATTPAGGATITTVEVIEIRFDDPMRVTAITLTGPEGEVNLARETGLDPVQEFRARPTDQSPEGRYTVEWRGLAADGHPMQGSFDFTIAD